MSQVLESYQQKEEHTSHCSFFTLRSVGKTSGEVIAEISGDHIRSTIRSGTPFLRTGVDPSMY